MNSPKNGAARLPTKWLIALVVGLVLYGFLQPTLNKRLGLKLPSVASILSPDQAQEQIPAETAEAKDRANADLATQNRRNPSNDQSSDSSSINQGASSGDRRSAGDSKSQDSPARSQGGSTQQSSSKASGNDSRSGENLKYGLLKDAGRGAYMSPAGILYTPYSGPDRHRLDHIAKHTKDDPARPIHGVFDGDMSKVVVWLDEAYEAVKSKARNVKTVDQGSRTRYDVRLGKTIGYVGGRDGARSGKPKSQTVRMIMEKSKIITAYPIR